MGTRSITLLPGETAVLYRQMDGYPECHGRELAEFLANHRVVNGISLSNPGPIFNGPSCAAAAIVAHFKNEVGGFYLYPADSWNDKDGWEEYRYTVTTEVDQPIRVKIESGYKESWETIFDGTPEEFLANPLSEDE